jgi:hypothetical protein
VCLRTDPDSGFEHCHGPDFAAAGDLYRDRLTGTHTSGIQLAELFARVLGEPVSTSTLSPPTMRPGS